MICNHPELRPNSWDEPKPEPCEMIVCECGQNAYCPTCRFGYGSYPCKCGNKWKWDSLVEDGMERYKDIWEALAKE